MMRSRNPRLFLLACATLLIVSCGDGTGDSSKPKVKIAFISNGVADFWNVAAAGARAGAKEFDAEVEVLMPTDGIEDQKRMVENQLSKGIDGIAISPIHGANQATLINDACERTHVITQDSDAPGTKRRCFIGVNNYAAGRSAGVLVKEALPEGGKVMIFVGRLGQDNARLRRQGVIDELLGRSVDPNRAPDPTGQALKSDGKYLILDTLTDDFSMDRAKANAEDTLTKYPDVAAMVGLFAYNPPCCLGALRSAEKLGVVKVVAFDEDQATLAAIANGTVQGTIAQDPFAYGRESVRVLAGLARGDASVVPEGGVLSIPHKIVRKADVAAFSADLAQKIAAGK